MRVGLGILRVDVVCVGCGTLCIVGIGLGVFRVSVKCG